MILLNHDDLAMLLKGCIQSHQYIHDNTLIKRCGVCGRSETREGLDILHLADCLVVKAFYAHR